MVAASRQRVVILGAGFAGLAMARSLENTGYSVFLIDRHNYHQFQPLMYQVATARLEPSSISFPLRKVFQHKSNMTIRIAEIEHVDTDKKIVHTTVGEIPYDRLVIAMGCTTNYFGNAHIKEHSFPMKSVPNAMALRNRQALLNFVIVGGGPTGVELAGAMAEMKKNILPKDYPEVDFSRFTIFLLEGSPNTLNAMSDASKAKSRKYLEELGVRVRTGTVVQDYDGNTVVLKDGETIPTKNVIWAAGVIANLLDGIPATSIARANRLKTNRFGEVEGLDGVYAIGDVAYMPTPKYPNGHPQVANVAIAQATHIAKNFMRELKGKPRIEYEYHNLGTMATVGKRKAVVDLPGFSFQGRLAWLTWMFVHLMLILSVRNKVAVFFNWMMSYFANDSTLRLMLKADRGDTPFEKIEAPVAKGV
jgi:NADH dehydrogenase